MEVMRQKSMIQKLFYGRFTATYREVGSCMLLQFSKSPISGPSCLGVHSTFSQIRVV